MSYDDDEFEGAPEVRISSVIFGLMMVIALIVATAAWMGGSLSKVEMRFANAVDGVARSVGLSVDNVSVVGVEGELAEAVRLAAMVEPGENMFRADPHLIKRRVEATRRVVNVSVYRLWPDQIQIYAYPAEPVALWSNGENWAVIDSLGRQMTGLPAESFVHLPKLSGEGGAEAAPELARALAMLPGVTARLQLATRIEDRRWNLVFENGAIVRLPADSKMPAAVQRLAGLQQRARLLERPVISIDLRVADRIFVKPVIQTASGEKPEAA